MSWRNHANHKEETKAVKAALQSAGYDVKVGHGTGTDWGWLEIEVFVQKPLECLCAFSDGFYCSACKKAMNQIHDPVQKIAQAVTGRTGDYNGDISIQATIIK